MKNFWIVVGIALALVVGIYLYRAIPTEESIACTMEAKICPDGSVVGRTGPNCAFAECPVPTATTFQYENAEFGFLFTLPDSWKGYTIVKEVWTGTWEGKTIATGTKLSIRHPFWTTAKPRQDIPVLVFTLAQWNDVLAEKMSLGAAPIGPSELGRNSKYVFALPARYNFAFPEGFEEVETIIADKPLKGI